jgi:hypothetical protein
MQNFLAALRGGLANASRLGLVLPLYLVGLALGLAQAWPAVPAGGGGPLLDQLAAGEQDALTLAGIANPSGVGSIAMLWAAASLLGVLLFAAAYNLFSGGILSVWGGGRFWAGCRRHFWGFVGLGALLVLLAILALVAAGFVGAAFGFGVATVVALVLLELVNVWGEYGRAAAVRAGSANPLAALGGAARLIAGRPLGVLALAALGVLLHVSIWGAYNALAGRAGWAAPLLQQAAAFAWIWVKLLRLGWASAYTGQ